MLVGARKWVGALGRRARGLGDRSFEATKYVKRDVSLRGWVLRRRDVGEGWKRRSGVHGI